MLEQEASVQNIADAQLMAVIPTHLLLLLIFHNDLYFKNKHINNKTSPNAN